MRKTIHVALIVLMVVSTGLVFAGGQGESSENVTMIEGAPAPFDGSSGKQLHIAHLSYLQEGEFMQMYVRAKVPRADRKYHVIIYGVSGYTGRLDFCTGLQVGKYNA